MGYTLSVEVDSKDKAKSISAILNSTCKQKDISGIKNISTDSSEHGYAPDNLNHGVYISYSVLSRGSHKGFWNIFQCIARELNTRMFYDDREVDIYEKINWEIEIYDGNFFIRWLSKWFNKYSNELLKDFKLIYKCCIKVVL